MTATFINIHGKADVAHTRADLMRHPAFAGLDTDSDGNPCVWVNSYTCQACTSEQIDWTDTWSCGCDDDCPQCGASHSPTGQHWLTRGGLDGPEYRLWQSLPEKPMHVPSLYGLCVTTVDGRTIEQPVLLPPEDRKEPARGAATVNFTLGLSLSDRRRLATILAALRFWQSAPDDWKAARFMDVATDGGEIEPLSPEEIDRLCEEINCQIEADPSF